MFAGVQKCLTHWMKTIYNYMCIFFYENDTNEVKSLCHDDCLEKRRKKHILHIELGHGG